MELIRCGAVTFFNCSFYPYGLLFSKIYASNKIQTKFLSKLNMHSITTSLLIYIFLNGIRYLCKLHIDKVN